MFEKILRFIFMLSLRRFFRDISDAKNHREYYLMDKSCVFEEFAFYNKVKYFPFVLRGMSLKEF
jgi:hypothetical protein